MQNKLVKNTSRVLELQNVRLEKKVFVVFNSNPIPLPHTSSPPFKNLLVCSVIDLGRAAWLLDLEVVTGKCFV